MPNPDVGLQANFKLPNGDLINVYGKDVLDFSSNLAGLEDQVSAIAKVGNLLRGLGTLADAGLTGQPVVQPLTQNVVPAPAPVQAAPAAEAGTAAPQCIHGARQYRANKPGAAKVWSAWMCPTEQGTPNQCKPIDAVTGKEWGAK